MDANKSEAPAGSNKPTCPKCGQEILQFSFHRVTTAQGQLVNMYYCSNDKCRCLFSAQIMGELPKAQPEKSRILSLH